MGLFKKMRDRAAAEDAALDAQANKARFQWETLSGVTVLDSLANGFSMMEEFYKSGELDKVDFMARRIAASELFDPQGVRPSLTRARSAILASITKKTGINAGGNLQTALGMMGRNGQASMLKKCCENEVEFLYKCLREYRL